MAWCGEAAVGGLSLALALAMSQPIHHKTQSDKQAMFNRHLQILTQATHSCVAAYDYARIRRLVRLEAGHYRLPVAEKQRSGLVARFDLRA